ncbi:MAG: hypothetical protein GXO91_00660 [FCB group bacterium]|nr:hypothetical protein [FCB group bacterium]
MKFLVRLMIFLDWLIVFSTLFFWYKQRFNWALMWLLLSLVHIYILAYSEFSKDVVSTYLKTKARSMRHKYRKARRSRAHSSAS